MSEPKDYTVTMKMTVWVTYGVEAYDDEDAETQALADANKDLPPGWDLTDWEFDEVHCEADVEMGTDD